MEEYDFIIIGSGPAGMSAAIYASRYMMKTLIIGQIPGGIAGTAHKICNYPGFKEISGMEIALKMIDQVKTLKVPLIQDAVTEISKTKNLFEVKTSKSSYFGKKILLATGTQRKNLGLPNEKEFIGKGLSYCTTCDSGFYKNKIVAIVGGGNAALSSAILLSKIAKKVYLIYRKNEFLQAEPAWTQEVKNEKKIEILFEKEITELIGKEKLEKIKLNDGKELELNGLFVEIGSVPNVKLAEQLKLKLENGSILVDKNKETNVKGVFAAGDVTNTPFKQIITACGDGAIACYSAYKEINSEKIN